MGQPNYVRSRVNFESVDLNTPTSTTELSAQWNELTVCEHRPASRHTRFRYFSKWPFSSYAAPCVRPIKLRDKGYRPQQAGGAIGGIHIRCRQISDPLWQALSFIFFQYGFFWSLSPSYCRRHLYIGYWAFLLLQLLIGTSQS